MLDISFCIWLSYIYIYIFISYLWIHKHCTLKCVYFWFQHTNLQLSWCLLQNSENMCVAWRAVYKTLCDAQHPTLMQRSYPPCKSMCAVIQHAALMCKKLVSFGKLCWCKRNSAPQHTVLMQRKLCNSACHSACCTDAKEAAVIQHDVLMQKKLLSFSMTCWCKRSCCSFSMLGWHHR